MSLLKLASNMGVTTSTLTELINGKVTISIGKQLGCMSSSIQQFVDGGTSQSLASKMGCMSSDLQELRIRIGKQGAIGLVIGLCIKTHEK